ncbi:hypothetical protein RHMOL_Rhmol10G0119800 [Rhododendron molle]|uniref:Uncharacterized protein n=1 Tax=Rhododendron molle TaxID=49168 RepID=A0ACC0M1V2_RHOML|nr:hypothetical protein RHMOL_Rhmol10G0119800 [Rhododendron molle]
MMDFRGLDLEGFSSNGSTPQPVLDPDTTKPHNNGSGFLKQGRSGSGQDEYWRASKVARAVDSESPKTLFGTSMLMRSDSGQQEHQNMISFSSPKSESHFLGKNGGLAEKSSQNSDSIYFQQTPHAYARNAGSGNGGMRAPLLGARGPFTPSQWVELEHQALIYKYMLANVPVPSNLLIPLKISLSPFGLSGLSSGSYPPNSFGWGSFHLGYSGNTDPEPGRCRRTDGKKWRCSRDTVADQKYCERHLNRNRHRSRKPVEGQTGQAVSGSSPKVAPISCSTSTSNSIDITQHQFKGLHSGGNKPSADVLVNRMQDPKGISMPPSTTNLKSKEYPFSIPKKHISNEESSGFGLVSSDSLLNPSRETSYMNSRHYNPILDFNNHKSDGQHSLRHFTDDWPKDQSNRGSIAWPEELKSDWTQLSMSIPMAASDFSSTSSSSPQEKISPSPLSLSHEQMGLMVNKNLNESTEKQTNWIPVSWGSAMGGPLGEVLNLKTGVPNGSPQLGSSPTGVLHKTTFVSLSNSSSGKSSPRADNMQTNETSALGSHMIGSILASPFTIPSV